MGAKNEPPAQLSGRIPPQNEAAANLSGRVPPPLSQSPGNDSQNQSVLSSDCEFHVIVGLAELGVSVIDHTPEEILYLSYLSVQNLLLAYSTGLGSGLSRYNSNNFKLISVTGMTFCWINLEQNFESISGVNVY